MIKRSIFLEGEKAMKTLYVVLPCYNEEEVLPETSSRLLTKMNALIKNKEIDAKSKILFVNDGSKDKTWTLLESLHKENPVFSCINLSSNRGHQNALLAGLMYAKNHADMTISMDADLQDDINAMDEMISYYHKGIDIVYAVRSKRKTDTFFKRFTAESFYRVMNTLGVKTVFNHADYRLMSKRALEGLAEFSEVNLFLRGIVPLIGYPTASVYFERSERFAGESKYPLKKMLSFAIEGITSFSTKPIRMVTYASFLSFIISITIFVYSLAQHYQGNTVPGWTSLIVSLWFIGGMLLMAIGIVGEYVGKIYIETKKRPRYLYSDILDKHKE